MDNVVVEAGVLHLVRAGSPFSFVILSVGLVTMLWGMANLLRQAPSRLSVILQMFVALMPAIIGLYGTFAGYEAFTAMAGAEIPPKPADLGRVVAESMACGILGPLATVLSVGLGLLAVVRLPAPEESGDEPPAI